VVTSDNAPWWANSIGRVRRLDPVQAQRLVETVLEGAERTASAGSDAIAARPSG
jgi:hypothetical protein